MCVRVHALHAIVNTSIRVHFLHVCVGVHEFVYVCAHAHIHNYKQHMHLHIVYIGGSYVYECG